ncbi:MAG: response regulator [Clostridium sp.]|nr:response regulator [Clostridium sp.]
MPLPKKPLSSYIDTASDLRVRIFRILATGGFTVSALTGIINLVVGLPIRNTIMCWSTALLSLVLILYASRTGRYRTCVRITIVLIFLVIFTFLFLDGGGYKSGMPLYFVMAVVFTAFMLEGAEMFFFSAVEILWYSGLCIYAYRNPGAVNVFEQEIDMLTDILIALPVVSVVLASTMYLQLQLIRKKQEELEEARKEALSASEAKTAFLANMSHDIRTPLNTVMSLNELIAGRTASDEIRGWTDDIRLSCDILLSLVGDILDLSRIESGRSRFPEAPYLTVQLLQEAEATWERAAKKAGLSFRLMAEESLPSVMSGHLDSIRKIVNNLVGNAVKYTEQGGVTLRFLKELPDAEQVTLRIEVEDTGIGIPPEELDRVFLPFERGNFPSGRGAEGTGLGLAIVKDLVEALQGTIRCDSRPGQGSLFTVRIPQRVQDPEPIGTREHWSNLQTPAETFDSIIAPDARVLVVDDNEYNRQVMCTLLKPTLIQTDDVESGREALEMLEIRKYDLILMDIMMPEMNGMETLRIIREEHLADNTPVAALTADALAGTKERLMNAGFSDYLAKPVSMKELGSLLIKYLGDRVRLIRDPSFEKLTEDEASHLKDFLLPMHIHLEDTLELDGGSVDSLRMRAEHFLQYGEELEKLSETTEDFLREDLFHFVHSLKSAARSIGARDLAELAAFMERHREDTSLNELMIPVLAKEYRTVREGEKLLLTELSRRNEERHDE